MRDTERQILDAADALATAVDHESYVRVTTDLLADLIPGNHAFWVRTAFASHRAAVSGDSALLPYLDTFIAIGATHPGIDSYTHRPHDLSPRRLSDVSSAARWRSTPAYQQICRPLGAFHQLNVLVQVGTPGEAISWTITRPERDRDFTDEHLRTARALQPLLRLCERLHPAATATPEGSANAPFRPTPRETQVLALLAQGQTAAAIARRCGITPRTVRKHLENVYAKLECNDRLLAVQRARQLGWLATGSGPH